MLAEMLGLVTAILVCEFIWTVHVIVIRKSMTNTLSAPKPSPEYFMLHLVINNLAVGRGWDN